LLSLISCNTSGNEYSFNARLNPYDISPLTALIKVNSETEFKASIKVLGDIPLEQSFDTYSNSFDIPVVGLYPNKINDVVVTLHLRIVRL